MRICSNPDCKCKGKEQPDENFTIYGNYCKDCRRIKAKEWRQATKGTWKRKLQTAVQLGHHRMKHVYNKLGGEDTLTTEQAEIVFEFFNYECAYCGEPAEVVDHIEPLSLGGDHSMDNICPACSKCNQIKSNRFVEDAIRILKVSDERINKLSWAMEHLSEDWTAETGAQLRHRS